MSGTLLLQSSLVGLTNGFVYALIGLGIAVVFRGTRIINAMQGEFSLVGGLFAFLVLERLGLPMFVAFPLGVLVGAGLGFVIERVFVSAEG